MSKSNKKKTTNILLPGLEDFGDPSDGDLDNDPSLEAELLELMGSEGIPPVRKDRNKKKELKPIAIDANLLNLDIDEDINDGDLDENDPELLAELNSFLNEDKVEENIQKSVPTVSSSESAAKLENLKKLYQEAIQQAKSVNDSSKTRRYERSLNQIEELLGKVRRGQKVDESDFPPVVHVPATVVTPPKVTERRESNPIVREPPNKSPKVENKTLELLVQRQNEYKHAAIDAKTKDLPLAKGLMIVVKQFDEVILAVKQGEPFDVNEMPPPPSEFQLSDLEAAVDETPPPVVVEPTKPSNLSFGDDLKARHAFYKESQSKAKAEGNESKVRRLGRVVQQYEEALEAFSKKRPYNYEELPPPPSRQPLATQPPTATGQRPAGTVPGPVAPARQAPLPQSMSKNTKTLLERQAQFKAAALQAKKDGDLPLAKELLRQSKGFDPMIEASESGLPVNLSKMPALPSEPDDNFQLVNVDDCEMPPELAAAAASTDKAGLLKQLQLTLLEQIKTCARYQQVATKAADLVNAKRFETLAKSCEKDLNGVKCLVQQKADIPKFHYEYKLFSVAQANPDLGESDMSIEVVRGMELAIPVGYTADQLDTYVVLELPFPNDAFQTFTTETVRKTNNPLYNATAKFEVNLKSRVFQRVVKSKQLKADIFYRKGFLQKDKLLGTCHIKLDRLETQCTLHGTFDISENRKVIGGKLEVKVRLRSPLQPNQSESIKEKWLIIDDFNQNSRLSASVNGTSQLSPSDVALDAGSIDVLKFEIGEMRRKLTASSTQISASLSAALRQKLHDKEVAVRQLETQVKSGDVTIKLAYLKAISRLPLEYSNEAKKFLAEGNRDKAQISVTKKKIVEKEIEQMKDGRMKP